MNVIDALDAAGPALGSTGVLIVPKWDEGDVRQEWDRNKKDEVEAARKLFVDLKAKGYKAYRLDPKSGAKGDIIKEFDPNAEKIVMAPPFAGG